MLRACRRVLRPGGRLAFYTIFIAPEASAADRRRAAVNGPSAAASRLDHARMLEAAGFTAVAETDVTDQFIETASIWLEGRTQHAAQLAELEGAECFEGRLRESREQLRLTKTGVIRRSLFVAMRP